MFRSFCAFVELPRSFGIRIPGLDARSRSPQSIDGIKFGGSQFAAVLERCANAVSLTERQSVIFIDEKERPNRDRAGEQESLVDAGKEVTRKSPKIAASVRPRGFWYAMGYGSRAGRPGGLLLSGWWMWERFAVCLWPTFVPPECPHGTLKIRIVISDRPQVCLPDCSVIRPGARIIELHCNNPKVLSLARAGACMLAACRSDLTGIAAWLKREGDEIEAIFGVTLLGAGAARLGFCRKNLPLTLRVRAERLFMNGLLALYNKDGIRRLARGKTLTASPQEIWMSRQELLRRYGMGMSFTDLVPFSADRSEQRTRPWEAEACQ